MGLNVLNPTVCGWNVWKKIEDVEFKIIQKFETLGARRWLKNRRTSNPPRSALSTARTKVVLQYCTSAERFPRKMLGRVEVIWK